MYARTNFKSKKDLKTAVASGDSIGCFQPGPFGPDVADGVHCCEGPHYPQAHRWYAEVTVKDGKIVRVK